MMNTGSKNGFAVPIFHWLRAGEKPATVEVATMESGGEQASLRPWHHAAVFLVACVLIVSRRPDALLHAQFWGEDGTVFFADAYNLGWWPSLFRQFAGYFEVFPRLGAALALLVPLASAPLVLNLIAILNQALPVSLLLSSRSSVWGGLKFRVFMAGVFLATPNVWELTGTITNSQWFLAVSAYLLLVACRPNNALQRALDLSLLVLCGLSGPFSVFLFPISAFVAWKERDRWRWMQAGILGITCVIQAVGLLRSGGIASRTHAALGASAELIIRMIGGQLYLGSLLGDNGLAAHAGTPTFAVLALVAIAGTVLLTICLSRLPLKFKLFLLLSILILVASFIAPRLGESNGLTILRHIALGGGERYWYFPSLAIEWVILWQYQSAPTRTFRMIPAVLLCILCFGILLRWRVPAFQDMHFADYAKRFDTASPGTVMVIPENPPGWQVHLIKHAARR